MNLYRSFVLRCWREDKTLPDQLPEWRFALLQVGEKEETRGFANYEELVAFLKSQLVQEAAVAPPTEDGSTMEQV